MRNTHDSLPQCPPVDRVQWPHPQSSPHATTDFAAVPERAADLPGTALPVPVLAPETAMSPARTTHVIHVAWPEASARGATVIPSSPTGRNGSPGTISGGTG
jgi:hypothetical protein